MSPPRLLASPRPRLDLLGPGLHSSIGSRGYLPPLPSSSLLIPRTNLLLRLMHPTSGWEPSYRNVRPLMTSYIRAPITPIAFCPLSATTTSVTESFRRSVSLLVNGDTGSRDSLSGRIIKIWSTSAPLRDLTPVRLNGLFSSAVLNFQSRLDPALRIWSLTLSHVSSARQGALDHREYFTSALCGRGCHLGSGTGCEKSPFSCHQTSPCPRGNVIRSWGRSSCCSSLGSLV